MLSSRMVLIARILLFTGIVAIAAAAGAFVAFVGIILLGTLTGSDNMNGGLAMGAAGLAPVGALAGAALGAWLAWRLISRLDSRAAMAGGYGLAALAGLSVGGWFLVQELTDGNPYAQGEEPTVLIEWRVPETVRHDWVDGVYRFMMRSSYMDWPLSTDWDEPRARDEDGHTILRMRGEIRWRVPKRTFQFWRARAQDDRITVELDLPRDPRPTADYGPWREVESHPGHAFRTRVVAR